jgi:hypothetical protein
MDRVAFVGYWHFSDIEAARSNVSLRALLGRQREGAQRYGSCSHNGTSTFEADEHLRG